MEEQVSTSTAQLKTTDLQQQLCEAALYVSGRPLDLKMIGSVIGARSEDKIRGIATLLTPGPLRTLSFIALKQPVTQSYVVRVRGKLAYGHVKQLKDMDLISDERIGRTRMLRTTSTFADYFNLNHDQSLMKKELKKALQLGEDPQLPIETTKSEN